MSSDSNKGHVRPGEEILPSAGARLTGWNECPATRSDPAIHGRLRLMVVLLLVGTTSALHAQEIPPVTA
ncbi:MAG: hypothetical protein KDA96_10750, partial [Planctomycetaceae bacterium]|nr:hypothetical protein [Planctomycetaceae bacterium]